MQRTNILVSSVSSIPSYSIARSHSNRYAFVIARGCKPPSPAESKRSISFILATSKTHYKSQQICHLFLQRNLLLTMRLLTTDPLANDDTNQSSIKRFGSFASKAFIATATASASLAAYYCATAIFFSSAGIANGENTDVNYHLEKKRDTTFGIE